MLNDEDLEDELAQLDVLIFEQAMPEVGSGQIIQPKKAKIEIEDQDEGE